MSLKTAVTCLELLQCPSCAKRLDISASTLSCLVCKTNFPIAAGIPILLPDPEQTRHHWSTLLRSFEEENQESIRQLSASLVEQELPLRSRERIQLLLNALPQQGAIITGIMRKAGIESDSPSSRHKETPAQVPSAQVPSDLLSYLTLIHRDYAWAPETSEVKDMVDQLVEVLPEDFRLGKSLFLGAGTGHLAWELGNRFQEEAPLIALDINPLPLLVSSLLLAGEELSLFELPGHPLRSNFAAVERKLTAPTGIPPGLQFLFADGLEPPVEKGVWETVVTPWFLDQVPSNLATMLPKIHALLAEGGSWIQSGPLVYNPSHTKAAHRYCGDEFIKLVEGAGFDVVKASYASTSYLASPISTQSRSETVLNLHARRRASIGKLSPQSRAWLAEEGAELPIPVLTNAAERGEAHPMVSTVARLIDGKRSTRAIAIELIESGRLANDGTAEAAVRACLQIIEKGRRE